MRFELPRSLKRTLSLIRKEIQSIVKDRTAMIMVFLLPLIMMSTLAVAIQQSDIQAQTEPLTIGVIDFDTTTTYPGVDLSENFTATLASLDGVYVTIFENESRAFQALFRGTIGTYIIIEDGFEHALAMDLPAILEVHTSSTELRGQSEAVIAITEASLIFRAKHGWIRSEIVPNVTLEFVPEGDFLAAQIGAYLVVFGIVMAITMTSCQSIVGDVPLRRLLLTPASKVEVVLAKLAAYTIIGSIQATMLNVIWVLMFRLQLMTGFETLVIIGTLSALSGAVIGILISSAVTSRLQANQAFLIVIIAMLILSGQFVEVGILSEFLPINLGMEMIKKTAFKGLPLASCFLELSRTSLFCAIGTLIAILVLWRKRTLA